MRFKDAEANLILLPNVPMIWVELMSTAREKRL